MTCKKTSLGYVTAVVCTRGPAKRRRHCSSPGCESAAGLLCDYAVAGKTCDRPMCVKHATQPDRFKDVHFCETHAAVFTQGMAT